MKLNYNLTQKTRIDKYLVEELGLDFSRTKICKLIKNKKLLLNNEELKKCSHEIVGNGIIIINSEFQEHAQLYKWKKANLFEIIFENDDYLIIDKPDNLSVHPGAGESRRTLVNNLITLEKKLSRLDTDRPGIVHRLDKNTTGLMLIAKNDKFHNYIQNQFENQLVEKIYVGIVKGKLEHREGEINLPIGRSKRNRKIFVVRADHSKEAITLFKVIDNINGNDLVEFTLVTGRTHQIRVHMKYLKHPLLNDYDYGTKYHNTKRVGQYLHSQSLAFVDLDGKRVIFFKKANFNL